MAEKASTDMADMAGDEKRIDHATQPDLGNPTGRRKSVAMNIVENPLTVSRHVWTLCPQFHSSIRSRG